MTIKAIGQLLTASEDDRTARYRLLPYGEPGATSKGRATAGPGAVDIGTQPVVVNMEHDFKRPVGMLTAEETDGGLEGVVAFANTTAGNDALEEARAGLRAGISVELDHPVVRAGKLLAGKLSGAGLVVRPAYKSALLTAAEDLDESEGTDDDEDEDDNPPADNPDPAATPEEKETTVPKLEASDVSLVEQLTAALNASKAGKTEEDDKLTAAEEAAQGFGVDQLVATAFGLEAKDVDDKLLAAFDTVTQSDMYDPTTQPAYVGELWNGRHRPQIYMPAFTEQSLTGLLIEGWRINKKPIFDDWDPAFSGTKPDETMNDIHTNEVDFVKHSFKAKRIARGSRFDRVHVDFPNPAAMATYLREETQALSDILDAKAKTFLLGNAVPKTAAGSDATDVWTKIVLGLAHVLEYSTPTTIHLGNDLWRSMFGTAEIDRKAWLEAQLGLEGGTLKGLQLKPARISETDMNGRIVVSARPALNFYTLPGGPIRVDAQELQKGALDKAAFAYWGATADPDALNSLAEDDVTVIPTATPGIVEVS